MQPLPKEASIGEAEGLRLWSKSFLLPSRYGVDFWFYIEDTISKNGRSQFDVHLFKIQSYFEHKSRIFLSLKDAFLHNTEIGLMVRRGPSVSVTWLGSAACLSDYQNACVIERAWKHPKVSGAPHHVTKTDENF